MNRNVESRFAVNPTSLDMSRSRFDRNSSVKLSFNTGDIVPFYVDEVLPGDTFSIDTSKVVRLQTMITPMMDNLYLDTYYFYVPNRLVWNHWKEFNGENTQSAWIPSVEYEIPQITSPEGGFAVGTIADYMGIPTGVENLSVNALPFRAYALIMNEWFRDQNLSDPLHIPLDETTVQGVNTGTFVTDVAKGGKPYIAAKYHDYFTSALPSPQKGPDVAIPLGASGPTPVYAYDDFHDAASLPKFSDGKPIPAVWSRVGNSSVTGVVDGVSSTPWTEFTNFSSSVVSNGTVPMNLYADLVGGEMATINQLRMAFQIQKLYERDARGGR